jgi:hypothetical protein
MAKGHKNVPWKTMAAKTGQMTTAAMMENAGATMSGVNHGNPNGVGVMPMQGSGKRS